MRLKRLGLVGLMMGITAVATYVGSLIAGVGGAVVGAVSGVGVSALGEAGRQWLNARDTLRQLRERVFVRPEGSVAEPAPTPAAVLVAERANVPFIGREQEVSDLMDWCFHWNDDPLRLIVGIGGSGKTRLAQELTNRLSGWDCHWVRTGEEADALKAARPHKSVIVVDYAETKSRTNLAHLVRCLAWPPGRRSIRVLLIARADGDWWSELIDRADTIRERKVLANAVHMKLGPIAHDDDMRERHYRAAIKAFTDLFDPTSEPIRTPAFDQRSTILTIHIAALLAVLGSSELSAGQYDQLLDHEDRYWQRSAESCGLTQLSRRARRESVAQLALSGADSIADVAEQLKRVPHLAEASMETRRTAAQWLQDLYPGDGLGRLGSLRPHLLAEHLAVRELADDEEFLSKALRDLSEDRAHNAFTMLGYAAHHNQQASQMIAEAVAVNPQQMILPAVLAVVETDVSIDAALAAQVQAAEMDLLQLARVSGAIPRKSQSLDRTATVTRRKFIESGAAELSRIAKSTASVAEMARRQTELLEFVRIDRILQEEGRILPARIRKQLIKALKTQEKVLSNFGQLSDAEEISRQIIWVESHKPSG